MPTYQSEKRELRYGLTMSKYNGSTESSEIIGARIYTLKNNRGTEVKLMNFGATVMSLKVADQRGNFNDIVLGFDSVEEYLNEDYLKSSPYFGAIIGRYANRLGKAKFSIGKTAYNLSANNFGNTLHGGNRGFDKVFWNSKQFLTKTGSPVEFFYLSKDGEEGFPGNLAVTVVFTLTEDDELHIEYTAKTDKETVVNLTHHSYFNLAGQGNGDILSHRLQIDADKFMPIDENFLATGEIFSVAGTPFDFREMKEIGRDIFADDEQTVGRNGYDHNFVLNGNHGKLRLAATVIEMTTGHKLEILTTEPGLHFFSGNSLDGSLVGKQGKAYKSRFGFCLEPQHFPDSPNHPEFPSTLLKPYEIYKSHTIYKFSAIS